MSAVLTDLTSIRERIEKLNIPSTSYMGILMQAKRLNVAEIGSENSTFKKRLNGEDETLSFLEKHILRHKIKVVAAAIAGKVSHEDLPSELWLKNDIVPYIIKRKNNHITSEYLAKLAESDFNEENLVKIRISKQGEVKVASLLLLDDYKKITSLKTFEKLLQLAKQFKGKKLAFISATPRGGGVALMRHSMLRLFNMLEIDVKWYVLKERAEAFDITKTKFHNVLQGVSGPKIRLSAKDKKVYNAWIKENAQNFLKVFKNTDVIVIDDPQPSGLVPYIRKANPKVKIIYRSHIHIDSDLIKKKNSPQNETWKFIWKNIKDVDYFVSHPIKDFIPGEIPFKKIFLMPATTDPLDGLNKPLTREQTDYYMKLFDKFLLEQNQTPLNRNRPYIIQIARFDPSKGIPDVILAYSKLRIKLAKNRKTIPQLVIVGNGSVDDPDRTPIYNMTMDLLTQNYSQFANDVKVAKLPHNDQLLNALLRRSLVALQLSHKEGFEIKVTEALIKGKPVVAYNAGGIPLQIEENLNGYLLDVGDTDTVAEKLYLLLTNSKKYNEMSASALTYHRKDVFTVNNAVRWLFLANSLVRGENISGNGLIVDSQI